MSSPRIGVYICHCGSNIAGTVEVASLAEYASGLPGVVVARDYRYMCSSTGQDLIKQDIRERGLERVVVAACSPRMHELTFREVVAEAGLNPYLLAIANIREQCSWVTKDKNLGTEAARHLIRAAVARVAWQEPLQEREVEVEPSCLVVGGGVAGIQAALSVAQAGYQVYLVEKDSTIGGRMAQLDKTFPTLDCSACILTPKMVSVARQKNLELMTLAEVKEVSGFVGNFKVKVEQRPRYVDIKKCTGCGECTAVCPVEAPHEFDLGLSRRKAIYRSFPQAVPGAFVVDKKGVSPCRAACPAGVNTQGYLALTRQGKYQEAVNLILREMPFPSVCGRVCHHPCETACARGELDSPVAIRAVKRFLGDIWDGKPQPAERTHPEKVAIVGSGPAGLTAAYRLARDGYGVTVFESLPVAGGMLAAGIPEYRLPREVLHKEIAYIEGTGVEIKTNCAVGRDISIDDLIRQGYGAVFMAVGAHYVPRANIPGEDYAGVLNGIEFLRQVNLGKAPRLSGRVIVVGGGNTAIDAARSALRLGAKEVVIAYRRSRQEMPALPSEVNEAELEGVKIEFLVSPTGILGFEGRAIGLACIRVQLGELDASGRRRPVPIPGSQFTMDADTVILAIGQQPDVAPFAGMFELTRWGTISVDPLTLATNRPGVFAGGDAVSGAATVIEAVAAGKRAAESIERYLQGLDLTAGRALKVPEEHIIHPTSLENAVTGERPPDRLTPLSQRLGDFLEVEHGLSEDEVVAEASRCLSCAVCSECLQCETVCGPKAIDHAMQPETRELTVGAIILATGHEFFNPALLPQYNYKRFPNVIDSIEFERMCNASGPTGGEILLANGCPPKSVCFIHCVGCRDSHANTYCSRLCCMHAMKQAHLVKEKTGADVYELYIDIRAGGKGYEEFYERVQREGVIFIRGRGAEVMQREGRLLVKAEDTGLGRPITLAVDLVVLVNGMVNRADAGQVAQVFHVTRDKDGFFLEAHPKLRPFSTNTDGIFLAGTCQGPRDIPDTIAHANAAAAEVLSLLGKGKVTIEPIVAEISEEQCSGCKTCVGLCAYSAISFDEEKRVSRVNSALCKGCGVCVAACPSGAAVARHFTDQQMMAEIEALLADEVAPSLSSSLASSLASSIEERVGASVSTQQKPSRANPQEV